MQSLCSMLVFWIYKPNGALQQRFSWRHPQLQTRRAQPNPQAHYQIFSKMAMLLSGPNRPQHFTATALDLKQTPDAYNRECAIVKCFCQTENGYQLGSITLAFSVNDCYPRLEIALRKAFNVTNVYESTYVIAKIDNNNHQGPEFRVCPRESLRQIKDMRGAGCALIIRRPTVVIMRTSTILKVCRLIHVNSSPKKTSMQRVFCSRCHTIIRRIRRSQRGASSSYRGANS